MAVHNYVLSKYMEGTSKKDVRLDVRQMMERGSYAIADPKALIAYDVFTALEDLIDPRYNDGTIYSLLNKDGSYRLRPFDGIAAAQDISIIVSVDNRNRKYFYEVRNKAIVKQMYYVSQIDDVDVRYLVAEHIIAPEPGVGLIERCYRPYFRECFKAERYQSLKMDKYSITQGSSASGYRLFVVNVHEIDASQWYKDNMEIARQITEYNLDVEDYRYIASIPEIFSAIRADAYDDVSVEEQAKINREIYDSLRNYMPDDDLPIFDEYMENSDDAGVESITDQVIMMSLANAADQSVFDAIYKTLGHNDYRIGALTDDIYNAHPDEGFILATIDGELQWYRECYSIGMWEGAKGNPYFGKFQKNENDTLLSFREFRPDLFVDSLPDERTLSYWENKYLEETVSVRMKHSEMQYRMDENNEEIVIGDWYYAGLKSKKVVPGISFHRVYGSHTFTEDECKRLLSGEELVVEKFITKMDLETTIRGQLKDCSGLYDTDMTVEFVRTDINISKKRRNLNMELGIEEPGLPPLE